MTEKRGQPGAVAIHPEESDELTRERGDAWARMWRAVDAVREQNRDQDPDEELTYITVAVEEVRREAYEAEQRAKTRSGR